jgi:hypothetical protein
MRVPHPSPLPAGEREGVRGIANIANTQNQINAIGYQL